LTCVYTEPYPKIPEPRGDRAHAELKTLLLRGDFPFGVRMGEERLAGLLEVSRTPVREALARLHVEGLVERHPDGGYCPVLPDLETMNGLYEVRFALELDALDRPSRRGIARDVDALIRLREDWRAAGDGVGEVVFEPDPDFVLLDEDFHLRVAAASGNHALVELLGRVNERIRIVRMQDFLTEERVVCTVEEHLGVLDALLDGDDADARARLIEHFESSLAVVGERAAAALARMLTARGRR
jgi:DNA-binding GntR family transcriptional regulator